MCVFILFLPSSLIIQRHINVSYDTIYCTTSFYSVQLTIDDGSSETCLIKTWTSKTSFGSLRPYLTSCCYEALVIINIIIIIIIIIIITIDYCSDKWMIEIFLNQSRGVSNSVDFLLFIITCHTHSTFPPAHLISPKTVMRSKVNISAAKTVPGVKHLVLASSSLLLLIS